MKNLKMFKMPFKNKYFNKNQKVWIVYSSGAMAIFCVGKFRGKGRYVAGWVNYESNRKPNIDRVVDVEVKEDFYNRIIEKGKKALQKQRLVPN